MTFDFNVKVKIKSFLSKSKSWFELSEQVWPYYSQNSYLDYGYLFGGYNV